MRIRNFLATGAILGGMFAAGSAISAPLSPRDSVSFPFQLFCQPYLSKFRTVEELAPLIQKLVYPERKDTPELKSVSFASNDGLIDFQEFGNGNVTCTIERDLSEFDALKAEFTQWAAHAAMAGPFTMKDDTQKSRDVTWKSPTQTIYLSPLSDNLLVIEGSITH